MKQVRPHQQAAPRNRLSRLVGATTLLAAGTFAALAGGSGGPATATLPIYKVTSSLDGMTSLPVRTRWVASPTMPRAGIMVPQDDIDRVDFLIDGQLRWYAKKYPFTYAGWAGSLVTTFLSPGKHTFTTTVYTVDGHTASDTVVASVGKPTPPPAELEGRWVQQKSGLDPDVFGNDINGPWYLIFDEIGAWFLDPAHQGVVDAVRFEGDMIHDFAGVTMGRPGVDAYGATAVGGGSCEDGGPSVRQVFESTFRWSVKGDKLTVRAVKPGCTDITSLWRGTWTRVPSVPPRGPLTPPK